MKENRLETNTRGTTMRRGNSYILTSEICIRHSELSDEGARTIAAAFPQSISTKLNLHSNRKSVACTRGIASCLQSK